ncbi:hypothetical protein GCM10027612_50260 [Microbispora bryophytorum subsp. camponoti]
MTENERSLARDARRALREGPEGIARRQRARLAEAVAYARSHSPYYRELYRALPDDIDDPARLPVTDKKALMARFDDWVTDPDVTLAKAREFVADPALVGERFQGRYLVATTSGTSGLRGIFLQDERSVAVGNAVGQRARAGLGVGDLVRLMRGAGRTAIVSAPPGHFSTVAGAARFRRDHPRLGWMLREFSIHMPLPELAAELNRYNPSSLAGFSGMLGLLAGEQEAAACASTRGWSSPAARRSPRRTAPGSPPRSTPRSAPPTPPPSAASSPTAARTTGCTSTPTGRCWSRSTPTTGPSRRGGPRTPSC